MPIQTRIDPTMRKQGFFHPQLETLSPEERTAYLNTGLAKIVSHAYENAPAIQNKMKKAGVKPDDIRTLSDLEAVPITRKGELAALQQKDPPFGGFLGVPLERLKRICMSPGPIYDPEEKDSKDDRWAQGLFGAGFRKTDIAQITFSFHLVPVAFWFEDALDHLGAVSVPGGVGNTEQQVRLMKDLQVTGYIGTPSFLAALGKKAVEMGFDRQKDLNLQVAFVTAEMLLESLRLELEETFGMIIRQGYGTADVGCLGYECFHKTGMHIPYNCILEIVDPETGKAKPAGDPGEIVVTVFNEAYPMIRFGTGDLSFITDEPCACGRTTPRIVKILGRTDQVTKVKGMFIHPSHVDDMVKRFPEIRAARAVVTRKDHLDILTLEVETEEGHQASEGLLGKITGVIPEIMRVKGNVVLVPAGTLKEGYKKVDDMRKWD